MAFPQSVIDAAWKRSGGRCQCTRTNHNHSGQCTTTLNYGSRGKDYAQGWEAHHIKANGPNTLANCEILCHICHKATRSYGR